jgi:hypothetical protein
MQDKFPEITKITANDIKNERLALEEKIGITI